MATNASTLDVEAFMQEVTQRGLDVKGPSGGYLYAGYQGPNGWEVIRCANNPWYLYQANRIAQQTNGAGGAILVDLTLAAGQVAYLITATGKNSGTNSIVIYTRDEDNATNTDLGVVASGAATVLTAPRTYTGTTTSGYTITSHGLMIGPGQKLCFEQGGAGVDNDTLGVRVTLLLSTPDIPTWSVARSTNPGDVTLAASTISAANTLQMVPMP